MLFLHRKPLLLILMAFVLAIALNASMSVLQNREEFIPSVSDNNVRCKWLLELLEEGWQMYRNEEYCFEFKYSSELIPIRAPFYEGLYKGNSHVSPDLIFDANLLCLQSIDPIKSYDESPCTIYIDISKSGGLTPEEMWDKNYFPSGITYKQWVEEFGGIYRFETINGREWLFVYNPEGASSSLGYDIAIPDKQAIVSIGEKPDGNNREPSLLIRQIMDSFKFVEQNEIATGTTILPQSDNNGIGRVFYQEGSSGNVYVFDGIKSSQVTNVSQVTAYAVDARGQIIVYYVPNAGLFVKNLVSNEEKKISGLEAGLETDNFQLFHDGSSIVLNNGLVISLSDFRQKKITSNKHGVSAISINDKEAIFSTVEGCGPECVDYKHFLVDVNGEYEREISLGTIIGYESTSPLVVRRDKQIAIYDVWGNGFEKEYFKYDLNNFNVSPPWNIIYHGDYQGDKLYIVNRVSRSSSCDLMEIDLIKKTRKIIRQDKIDEGYCLQSDSAYSVYMLFGAPFSSKVLLAHTYGKLWNEEDALLSIDITTGDLTKLFSSQKGIENPIWRPSY